MFRFPFLALTFLSSLILNAAAQRGPIPGINTTTPYLIYYGNWSPAQVELARTNYQLVILHPVSNITATDIAQIQRGTDNIAGTSDDVLVVAYISVGEDDRTAAPIVGNGSGPRVDPRSSDAEALAGINPLGDASPNGIGFASYYLDDTNPDGQPDTNSIFGGPFVNAGDPAWYQVILNNEKDVDGASGLQEILTNTEGNGYGCDGVFLDTLDTPAPNSFGATLFEWTAPGFQTLLQNISSDYPDKLILGNRGIFFYNPNLKQYEFTLRPYLNAVLFESYYTDSNNVNFFSPFFDDNRFNWAPKLNAEANRADGFTVFSLGYDHPVSIPQSVKDQDFIESMQIQGWPLYRTNGLLNRPFNNEAQGWVALNPDNAAPVWDSTAATSADSDFATPGNQPPVARVGLQEVEALDGAVTLRWDVARDQTGPVRYHVYYTDFATLNFNTATKLSNVVTSTPSSYLSGTGADKYAYEATVTGLENEEVYLFAVRAEDSASPSNEDRNTTILTATPQADLGGNFTTISIDGDFTDWEGITPRFEDPAEGTPVDFTNIWVANDGNFLYLRFVLANSASPFSDFNTHLFIDSDNNSATGFIPPTSGFGSEFMIELGNGFDQRNGGFNEGSTSGTGWQLSPAGPANGFEIRVSLDALFPDSTPIFFGQTIRLLLQDNRSDEISGVEGFEYTIEEVPVTAPTAVFANIVIDGDLSDWAGIAPRLSLPSTGKAIDFKDVFVANDNQFLYGRFTLHSSAAPFSDFNTHLFIDTDGSPATGFTPTASSFGSEAFIESGSGFDQRNGGFNEGTISGLDWAISPTGNAQDFEFRISRTALYADFADIFPVFDSPGETLRLLLQDNRGDSLAGDSGVEFSFAGPNTVYELWKTEQFTPAQLADPTISGDFADPDLDGAGNLLEFALGMIPLLSDPEKLPQGIILSDEGQDYPGLRYDRIAGSGLTFLIEASGDLLSWDDDPNAFTQVSLTDLGNRFERVEIRHNSKISENIRAFFRLKVLN